MSRKPRRAVVRLSVLFAGLLCLLLGPRVGAAQTTSFAPGDIVVSLMNGQVQWWHANGSFNKVLQGSIPGTSEGMRFDASGNLYVTHWCADPSCRTGNTVEHFNTMGVSQGAFQSGYWCNPHAIAFDATGKAYVGQADCTGDILELAPGGAPITFAETPENRGAFWIDLAADNCTVFYTSEGPDVKRFNVCTNAQLTDFNVAPLPGGEGQDLRVLPDGGLIVSSYRVIVRLDGTGNVVQTYSVPSEPNFWAGLALVGDGTFWAVNYYSSSVYRFNLATGAVLSSINTGTPNYTAVAVAVSGVTGGSCPK